jgi:hypothetical protein
MSMTIPKYKVFRFDTHDIMQRLYRQVTNNLRGYDYHSTLEYNRTYDMWELTITTKYPTSSVSSTIILINDICMDELAHQDPSIEHMVANEIITFLKKGK